MTPSLTIIALAARDPDDGAGWLESLERAIRATGRSAELVFSISDRCPHLQAALTTRQQAGARFEVLTLTHWYDEAAAVRAGLTSSHAPLIVTLRAGTRLESAQLERLLTALEHADVALPKMPHRLLDRLSIRLFGASAGLAGRELRACRREALARIADRSVAFPLMDAYALWQGLRVEAVPLDGFRSRRGPLTGVLNGLALVFLYGLLEFAKRPLRLFGLIGTAALGLGLAITLPPVAGRLLHGQSLADDPALLPGLLLLALGLQCGVLGLVAELLVFMRSRALDDCTTRALTD